MLPANTAYNEQQIATEKQSTENTQILTEERTQFYAHMHSRGNVVHGLLHRIFSVRVEYVTNESHFVNQQ